MKKERSDVRFILWRKRVDKTLLKDGLTPIPTWLVKQWQIKEVFDFSDGHVKVSVKWDNSSYDGVVSTVHYENRDQYRLEIKDPAHQWLINSYFHSYEVLVIQAQQSETYEFLDIEFDPETKVFYLHDYYKHE